ncbi:hypothetical protein D9611_005361 [Ephemerocybe angulata]|uniref:Uncharacterized protein n=1 Tax=Ephemerocybe angulata TaxID=980116 RepID=A0A8H5FDT5_9AGAR|nr:hypothetical protein D9611_005361 [Tulosesus angulatus]
MRRAGSERPTLCPAPHSAWGGMIVHRFVCYATLQTHTHTPIDAAPWIATRLPLRHRPSLAFPPSEAVWAATLSLSLLDPLSVFNWRAHTSLDIRSSGRAKWSGVVGGGRDLRGACASHNESTSFHDCARHPNFDRARKSATTNTRQHARLRQELVVDHKSNPQASNRNARDGSGTANPSVLCWDWAGRRRAEPAQAHLSSLLYGRGNRDAQESVCQTSSRPESRTELDPERSVTTPVNETKRLRLTSTDTQHRKADTFNSKPTPAQTFARNDDDDDTRANQHPCSPYQTQHQPDAQHPNDNGKRTIRRPPRPGISSRSLNSLPTPSARPQVAKHTLRTHLMTTTTDDDDELATLPAQTHDDDGIRTAVTLREHDGHQQRSQHRQRRGRTHHLTIRRARSHLAVVWNPCKHRQQANPAQKARGLTERPTPTTTTTTTTGSDLPMSSSCSSSSKPSRNPSKPRRRRAQRPARRTSPSAKPQQDRSYSPTSTTTAYCSAAPTATTGRRKRMGRRRLHFTVVLMLKTVSMRLRRRNSRTHLTANDDGLWLADELVMLDVLLDLFESCRSCQNASLHPSWRTRLRTRRAQSPAPRIPMSANYPNRNEGTPYSPADVVVNNDEIPKHITNDDEREGRKEEYGGGGKRGKARKKRRGVYVGERQPSKRVDKQTYATTS